MIFEKHECSIHGKDGNPECGECCSVLLKILRDFNAEIISDFETKLPILGRAMQFDVTGDIWCKSHCKNCETLLRDDLEKQVNYCLRCAIVIFKARKRDLNK